MLRFGLLFFAVLIEIALAPPAGAAKRVALVIGNGAYAQAGTLTNPVNDATDMANALKTFGFEVILGLDLDRRSFDEKVRAFSNVLEEADAAVLFYAGHGLQVAGHNYLVPVDAGLNSERDLDFETVSLDFVLKQMEVGREGKTNIVFLDACRDNPLTRNLARSMGTRSASVGQGLAEVQTGVGTFIAYSTQPGNVALDGAGRNSPFTAALSTRVQEGGRNLTALMIEVRKDVLKATGGRQVPWDHSALTSDFYFQPVAEQSERTAATAKAASQPRQLHDDNPIAVLDALAAQQSWIELHDHLTDESPAKRDAHWEHLVEQAAIGELGPMTAPGGSAEERLAMISRYYPNFPSLRRSKDFLALRTKVGLQAFSLCFEERGMGWKCRDDLERFVHAGPITAELAQGAAHVVGLGFNRQVSSLYYALGLDAPGGEAICGDEELQYDIVVGLQLPPDYREAQAARTVAERCWEAVKGVVIDNVAKETPSSYYAGNACPLLIKHDALGDASSGACRKPGGLSKLGSQ
jgi:uncharacterized caspase-like protein